MPPRKKQKTSGDGSAQAPTEGESSSKPPEADTLRDESTILPHEYVCIHRPFFDFQAEVRHSTQSDNSEDGENENEEAEFEARQKYDQKWRDEESSGKIYQPVSDNKDWKWVMMWEGVQQSHQYWAQAVFSNPEDFNMYIYNDWRPYGLQECLENFLVEFNEQYVKERFTNAWATISALAHWLNESDGHGLFQHDDGTRASEATGLLGCALLTALATTEAIGELKPGSKYLDLPLVITSFLEWAQDVEQYGIESGPLQWRPYAVKYFVRGNLDEERGISGTKYLLEKLKDDNNSPFEANMNCKDPWLWSVNYKAYSQRHGKEKAYGFPKLEKSRQYDIRMLTRKERAQHAYDNKDPFRDLPAKDVKNLYKFQIKDRRARD